MIGSIESSLGALDERRLLQGVYVVRLSTAIALALAATVVRSAYALASPATVVILIVGVPLAWTIASLLWTRRRPISPRFLGLQVGHDLFLVTLAVLLTGGVGSEFAFLYVLLIAVAGLLLGMGGSIVTAAGSVVTYFGVAWAQIRPQFAGPTSEIVLPNLSGEAGTVLWSLALTGIVFAIVGVASGLAARRLRLQRARLTELEKQLAHARIDAQDLLNTVESGILSIDADEQIDFVNFTAQLQLGISGNPSAGEVRERAEAGGMRELYELMVGTLRSGREIDFMEVMLPAGAGGSRPFSVSTTVLYGPGGNKRGAAAILKNLEDVKRLEDLARQADRHKAVAILAAGLAHEIRNPLAAIRSSVELLEGEDGDGKERPPGEDRRLMSLIVREADRLSSLIQDFMAFSRTELRNRGRIDLVEVVKDALEVERVSAPQGGQVVTFSAPSGPYWVDGDYNLLKQVVLNLVTNAREAVGDRMTGRVEVRVGVDP